MTTPAPLNQPLTVPGLRVEVLKVGTFRDMHGRDITVTRDDLTELATSYDTARYRAPVVIGHPKVEDNAWGVIERFEVDGDSLYAIEGQVDAQFSAFRDAGHYAERSLSYFLPDSPNNPTPGKKHAKHLGFLGGAAPAVPGLERLQGRQRVAALAAFDPDDTQVVSLSMRNDRRWGFATAASLFRRIRDWAIEQYGTEKADLIAPNWEIDSLRGASMPDDTASEATYFTQPAPAVAHAPAHQGQTMTNQQTQPKTVDLAAQETALAARELRIKEHEDRMAKERAEAARVEAVAFADSLIADGRLLPRRKAQVVELQLVLPKEHDVEFAGEDGSEQKKPALQIFRDLFSALPKHIDFAEKSGDAVPGENGGPVDFAAAPGTQVDPNGLALLSKAQQYQIANPNATFLQAVKAVGGT